jgi:urease accessory protein
MLATLRAIWQADGAFPSGAFAFSYGLEGAIALRGKITPREFEQLVMTILRQRWASYDRIALLRAFRTGGDLAAIAAIDREVEASTMVEALRTGSRRNGARISPRMRALATNWPSRCATPFEEPNVSGISR